MIFYFRVYSTKTRACKWKMLVWAFLVDTTRVNVQNLAGLTHPQKYAMKDGKLKVSSVQFGNQAYLILSVFITTPLRPPTTLLVILRTPTPQAQAHPTFNKDSVFEMRGNCIDFLMTSRELDTEEEEAR